MFKTVLWATDGSETAALALPYALDLAEPDKTKLVVVHVREIFVGRGGGYPVLADESELREQIALQVKGLREGGLDATFVVRTCTGGHSARTIAEIAKEVGADLIVVGTHGYGRLANALLGSVTMGLLHAGSRVDLQAASERNGPTQLRTILQNVEVLRVNPQLEPAANSHFPVPVATMLVPAQYADIVALADTGARLRITLRNPLDEATAPRHALGLASVFNSVAVSEPQRAQRAQTEAPANVPVDHAMELNVQVLGASAAALGQLDSKLAAPSVHDSMRVAAFRTDTNADELVRKLEQTKELEVVSSSSLTASLGRPVSVRAAAAPYRLRVQFSPAAGALGKVSLRVQPEVSVRNGPGVETRRYDADLPDGSSFLVRGLLQDADNAEILARLFPGHSWSGRELVIYVTARSHGQAPSSAVAQTGRGQ